MIDEKDNETNDESGKNMSKGYNLKLSLIVNIIVFVGFNITWFMMVGKGAYGPWGDIFYVLYGAPILFVIELICNICLCIFKKADILSALVMLVFSMMLFMIVTYILVNSPVIENYMQNKINSIKKETAQVSQCLCTKKCLLLYTASHKGKKKKKMLDYSVFF